MSGVEKFLGILSILSLSPPFSLANQMPSDGVSEDLGCAATKRPVAGPAQEPLGRHLLQEAVPAEHLHRAVRHPQRHLVRRDLRDGRFGPTREASAGPSG